jgi:Spy/CpxP family protein refolding chaperone
MKNVIILKTWLVIGFLVFATSLTAQPHMGRRQARQFTRPRSGGLLMALKARQEELSVTDDQLAQIKELQGRLEEQTVEHRNNMNTLRFKLKQSLRDKESRDYDSLKAQLTKNAQAHIDFRVTQMKLRAEIADVLTEEQKDSLRKMRRAGMRQDRGNIRGRNPRLDARERMPRQAPRIRRFRQDPETIR